jgi:S1-C subfamily serine protease
MTPEQIAEGQRLSASFFPRTGTSDSTSGNSTSPKTPTATGTGFFITDDGYLISNYHVVKDAVKVRLLTDSGVINATVVKVDAANDLALLKAAGQFAPLPVAASRGVKLGGTVATVGFPDVGLQGFSPKLAKGEIASLSGSQDDPRYFQISVPVQPGNSGGALVDVRGNVVGIVSGKLSAKAALAATGSVPENVNYAVKSSLLLSFLESVPDVANKLKEAVTVGRKFEDVVKSAQDAAVLVLVYLEPIALSHLQSSPRPLTHSVHGLRSDQITHRLSTFAPHTAEMEIAWSNVASLPACLPAKARR